MGSFVDLTGRKFDRLLVLGIDQNRTTYGNYYWICKCDCGNIKSIRGDGLKSGAVKSCGCLNREIVSEVSSKINSKYNEIVLYKEFGFGKCFLNNGDEYFIFDIEDFDIIKEHYWCKNSSNYIISSPRKNSKSQYFHRLVMQKHFGDIKNKQIDHRDHNTLNNRKENLKICTSSENSRNTKNRNSNTGIRNISYNTLRDEYQFQMKINNVAERKSFKNIADAKAYKEKYINEHPDEFRYNEAIDKRNQFNNIIAPFIDYNTNQPLIRKVTNPFKFI